MLGVSRYAPVINAEYLATELPVATRLVNVECMIAELPVALCQGET